MLEDKIHPQDQHLSIEGMKSPLGAQMLEFCESGLFPETLQNSEVASSSNCCYEDHSSFQTQLNNFNESEMKLSASTDPSTPTAPIGNLIFHEEKLENDISASIDFTTSPSFTTHNHHQYTATNINNNNHEQFNISSLNNQLSLGDVANTGHQYGRERWSTMVPIPPLSASYNEEECQLSSFVHLRTSQPTIHDPMISPFLPPFSAETFTGMHFGPDQELDFQGDNAALFLADNMTRVFNYSSELQGLGCESQHLVQGGANSGANVNTSLASEISSLEDPTFKVGKLSVEERKRKIHRYMKKRNERNFSKKIKYACRKTLADSRPRVRGRFAKNDELGEAGRNTGNNHEDETDEDVGIFSNSIIPARKVGVKEEDDMESSDILAHISGVNSFKCNYPIQSWI